MHSLYAGAGSGLLMALCGLGSFGAPRKGEPSYKRWMIAVHVGLMLNALFTAVFALQFARARRPGEGGPRAALPRHGARQRGGDGRARQAQAQEGEAPVAI